VCVKLRADRWIADDLRLSFPKGDLKDRVAPISHGSEGYVNLASVIYGLYLRVGKSNRENQLARTLPHYRPVMHRKVLAFGCIKLRIAQL
jgi:hypothetical protein